MENKKKRTALMALILLCLILCSCGRTKTVYLTTQDTESFQKKDETEEMTEVEKDTKAGSFCCVYVCGAVVAPGVYTLPVNSRICDAIYMAGGLLEEAAPESLNQAQFIEDGQMILVLSKEELKNTNVESLESEDGKINLNTATAEQLMNLPGIGQAKADSILSYRAENGKFSSVEDIKKIEGIKEGVYSKIKDRIAVN